ncbi:MAG: CHRD domain-containing protein [Verrucomicrobia bacterium]|jgi:hypothetical protein|nr:CHRD domain-containing protein [Verrucomicrobiota bacterium]
MNTIQKKRTILTMPVVFCALLFTIFESTQARSFRPGLIPNGKVISCANCHIRPSGGGQRTSFGEAVRLIVGGGSNMPFWSPTLAALDSDGDGFTNGQELGDPDGDGVAEAGAQITHPGDANSFPDISDPEPVSTTLFIEADGKNLTLTWEEGGILESSENFLGPWNAIEGATSPFQASADGPMKFYRVGDGTGGQIFTLFLNGGQELPAVTTGAKGSGTVSIDGKLLTIHVQYDGLESNFAAAHIHGPAGKGVNAGVLFGLSGTDLHQPSDANSGMFTGSAVVSDAIIEAIKEGEAYLNIHTSGNGGGEIRGQINP